MTEKKPVSMVPRAADSVSGNGAYGIINLERLVDKLNGKDDSDTGNQSNGKGSGNTYGVAAGSNGDETGKGAVQGHGDVRLAVTNPRKAHDGSGTDGGSHVGGHINHGGREQ